MTTSSLCVDFQFSDKPSLMNDSQSLVMFKLASLSVAWCAIIFFVEKIEIQSAMFFCTLCALALLN